jgi:uncharacterized protein (DUF1697 family)
MTKYAAFLRGINVGGKNKIKMETLRETFAALQFENVQTYINSGNVIFETAETNDKKLAEQIENAIEKEFSLNIKVMVRTIDEIREIINNNPFDGQFENDKDLHVLFLDEEMPEEKRELLISNNSENEKFVVRGGEIFCHLKNGFASSLLGKDYIGKKLKVSATARNWRTVNKVLEFSKGTPSSRTARLRKQSK